MRCDVVVRYWFSTEWAISSGEALDFRVAGPEERVDLRVVGLLLLVVVVEGVEGVVAAACRFGAIAEVCCCWIWVEGLFSMEVDGCQ